MLDVRPGPGEDDLPKTRSLVAQELASFDDGRMLRDYLSTDRTSAAALGYALDAGSVRTAAISSSVRTMKSSGSDGSSL